MRIAICRGGWLVVGAVLMVLMAGCQAESSAEGSESEVPGHESDASGESPAQILLDSDSRFTQAPPDRGEQESFCSSIGDRSWGGQVPSEEPDFSDVGCLITFGEADDAFTVRIWVESPGELDLYEFAEWLVEHEDTTTACDLTTRAADMLSGWIPDEADALVSDSDDFCLYSADSGDGAGKVLGMFFGRQSNFYVATDGDADGSRIEDDRAFIAELMPYVQAELG